MMLEPLPIATAGTDRDVRDAGSQIDHLVAGRHPDRQLRMIDLEGAEPPREPGVRECVGRRDREERLVLLPMARERSLDRVERSRQGRK
jgi:hypothetical protein